MTGDEALDRLPREEDGDGILAQALALPGFRGVQELGATPLRLVVDYGEV